ncbi:spore coat associated protein CotJA [Sporomusa sp.]|uniref:spore coat associated protein CotJA n=1 Tax=Sporomusa sp. TaxID=2078658 RepID=UPI002CCA7F02|nr:spore coat associated protein CotJA [Sporomusa sp.]HWR42021.1 spore coat associated protein CotJA [Sporomusa sp.]
MRKKIRHQMYTPGKSKAMKMKDDLHNMDDMCEMDDMEDMEDMCDMDDMDDMEDMCDMDDMEDMEDMCDMGDMCDMDDMNGYDKPMGSKKGMKKMKGMKGMDKGMAGMMPDCIMLAHSYVPWQYYEKAFTPSEALMKGTLFPELWGVYKIPK